MIMFWGDDHAFWTVAMLYHTSSSQNQNKKLVPTRILQIAQTNSLTWVTSWIVKVVWKRLSNRLQTTSAEICGEVSTPKWSSISSDRVFLSQNSLYYKE